MTKMKKNLEKYLERRKHSTIIKLECKKCQKNLNKIHNQEISLTALIHPRQIPTSLSISHNKQF